MRINLRCSNIGMPQQSLHTTQIRSMFHHMRRATMPQLMRTSLIAVDRSSPYHLPNPLPRQRISPHTQETSPLHPSLHQSRPSYRQISFQSLHRRPPQRNDPLLIALASHLRPRLIQMQVLHSQRNNLPYPQTTRIQQLQNRVVPERQPIRICTFGRGSRPLHHLRHLALSKRLRQHLPARWRLNIHRRIMPNPFIHQQPAIEPTQTTQLTRNRPRLNSMPSQPFHKPAHIRLRRPHQQPIPSFNMLRKLLQVPSIRLATRWPQTLFHLQICHKLPHRPRVPAYLAHVVHRNQLSRPTPSLASPTYRMYPPG